MTIRLRPELEELIRKDAERGPYHTVDEYVELAVRMLHEHEEWLSANRADIAVKIDEGYAAARGELMDQDQIRTLMSNGSAPGGPIVYEPLPA